MNEEDLEDKRKKKNLALVSWLAKLQEESIKACKDLNYDLVADLDIFVSVLEILYRNSRITDGMFILNDKKLVVRPEILDLFPPNFRPKILELINK